MTLAIDLDDRAFSALLEKAAESGVTPEQLASDLLGRSLRGEPVAESQVTAQSFKIALAESVRANEELLRRLAK
jgi:hypothetical protein